MMDKDDFIRDFDEEIENSLSDLPSNEKNYLKDKANKIANLLIELEQMEFLKTPDETEKEKLKTLAQTIHPINKLYESCVRLVEDSPETIKLISNKGKEESLDFNQIVYIITWTYCSSCEIIKNFLIPIIDYPRIGRKPYGIGELIKSLRDNDVTNLSFFDDIDIQIRNSFFHLDFKVENNKVYYDNQNESITLANLIRLVSNGDRSSFTVMRGCMYFIR